MTSTYLTLLKEFLAFPSISTDPQYQQNITQTAQWLAQTFQDHHFDTQVITGYSNPIVIASYLANPNHPTCLIYGHYDVQPASQDEGWQSDPFQLHITDTYLYGRGVIDNKGQVLIHIAAIFELIEQQKLQYNIKFMLEGNEETGSPTLAKFISEHQKELRSDFILISDGEITADHPVIELGFRGGFNSTLTLRSASNDLHSGIYGGAAPNSAFEMTKLLSKLFDSQNRITIPGFYDDVEPLDGRMRIPFDQTTYSQITGAKTLLTEPATDFYNQVGLRPTLQITGLQSGYVGDGYRNSIPHQSTVKINARLVQKQNPQTIIKFLRTWISNNLPDYLQHQLQVSAPYEGIKLDVENPFIHKAAAILAETYATEVYYKYSGGGLPVVTTFHQIFGVPQLLIPFANEDCAMHGANENFNLELAQKAYQFSQSFFST
jgi:acetylornithine deacetylase/succinyl-diaminopimelate desuccinylase-like protein